MQPENRTLYVCCPANAVQGPAEAALYYQRAESLAGWFEAEVVLSPLMNRFLGASCQWPIADRVADFNAALQHDVIWAARGGYGSVQLLEHLRGLNPAHHTLVGFSDVTSLHALWHQRATASIYGAPPDHASASRAAKTLSACCARTPFGINGQTETMVNILRPGHAEGVSFAACLTVLAHLCGTPYVPDLNGCILFLEDINEAPRQWDAALYQLYYAGVLSGIAGLVGGCAMFDPDPDYAGPSVDDVLKKWADRLEVPAVSRLPFGHLEDAMAVPNGWVAALNADTDDWQLKWRPVND